MSTDRDTTRIVRSWMRTDEHASADRVLDAVLDQLDTTPQRRATWWPVRRFPEMNNSAKLALAAAAVVVGAFLGIRFLLPGQNIGGPGPTPSPTASPAAFHTGRLTAGTYVMTPFAGNGASGVCMPQATACTEDPADDSYRLTFTVPDGYEAVTNERPLIFGPGGTGMIILRGGGLYSDPCHSTPPPDISVGPTVDDFAEAIADHPLLDATDPVDVTLAGYSGKYVDLQLPSDTAECTPSGEFWPYEPGMYAQGNDHQWHLWILDVDGVRVVIQSMDYPDTTAERRAELQAIVDSIQIEP